MYKYILLFLLIISHLNAKVLISPIEAMKENFINNAQISKKNILLSNSIATKIQQDAQERLTTKIYRIYIAKKNGKILGYGILINKKVRSKNAVVLYLISNGILQDIEIIAFNESREYLPTKMWNSQFKNISTKKMLKLSRNIVTITGATLSARSVTNGSRIAFAIYNKIIKGK